MSSQVEQFISQLDDSSSEESEDYDKNKEKSTRGRRHNLRSGKARKLTSRVVNPQLWPHSHLNLSYVSKDKKYDDLTLAEFAPGYTAILQKPTLSPQDNLCNYRFRAFSVALPQLWNALPLDIQSCNDISEFKRKLKTYLFRRTFS